MHARYYSRRKLRGRGAEDFVLVEPEEVVTKHADKSKPKPIASQSNNERKLVNMIQEKIESNSIIDKKKSKPKKIEYISTEALLR